jgi:rubrerythrin
MAFSDVIGQAVAFEVEAYEFYDKAIEIVSSEQAKTILRELRAEEESHKLKLEDVLSKGPSWAVPVGKSEEVVDLKLGEFVLPSELTSSSDFQDALMIAIKREEASYEFYSKMVGLVSAEAKPVFEFLANEEAKHKNKVQDIYDQIVYQDN